MKRYTPRRANVKRWLEGAPDYILDVFDTPNCVDRYTVLFGGKLMFSITDDGEIISGKGNKYDNTYVQYLTMSDTPTLPNGVSMWGEMKAYQAANYRYSHGKYRIRWLDLPQHIRDHVVERAKIDE